MKVPPLLQSGGFDVTFVCQLVTFLVSTKRKFNIRDIIVLNKLTLTQSKLICALCGVRQSFVNFLIEGISNHIHIELHQSHPY